MLTMLLIFFIGFLYQLAEDLNLNKLTDSIIKLLIKLNLHLK
jgi:hypothetical protein